MNEQTRMTNQRNYKSITFKMVVVLSAMLLLSIVSALNVAMAEETADTLPGQWLVPPEDVIWGLTLEDAEQQGGLSDSVATDEFVAYSDLPEKVDLSSSDYFPPIRSQGSNGSCAAWASTYYQFTYEAAKLNGWNAKTDDTKVFSPKYVWNYLNNGENKGVSRSSCYSFLGKYGAVSWSDFPQIGWGMDWYDGNTSTLMTAHTVRANIADSDSGTRRLEIGVDSPAITSYDDSNLYGIKLLLSQGRILTFDTFACNWRVSDELSNNQWGIISATQKYTTSYEDGVEKEKLSGHAMTIVGYDDTISFDYNRNGTYEDNEKGALLLANSWGTSAGQHNEGYIWVMYDALNAVSNFSEYNASSTQGWERDEFIYYGQYYILSVANYTPELMVEVTLRQPVRNDIIVQLGGYTYSNDSEPFTNTFLNQAGGERNFGGYYNTSSTLSRTFLFDYGALFPNGLDEHCIKIKDNNAENTATEVLSIRWLDSEGNVIKAISPQQSLNGSEQIYWLDDHGDAVIKATNVNLYSQTISAFETKEDVDYYKFVPSATGTYLFYSTGNIDTKGILYNDSETQLIANDDWNGATNRNFGFKYSLVAGQTYYIRVSAYSNTATGSYSFVVEDDHSNTTEMATALSLHTQRAGNIETSGDVDYLKFTPSTTGTYLFYTTGTTDTQGYLYDSTHLQLATNDDSGISGYNFALNYSLTAGQTYYIQVKAYSTKTGAYVLNISRDFYTATLNDTNQDARRVLMQAEAAAVLNTMNLTIGNNIYTITKPSSGTYDNTFGDGTRIKVTFETNNSGLSTIWIIQAKMQPTTLGTTDSVTFAFSGGKITATSPALTGLVAYASSVKTGVSDREANSLQLLMNSMSQTGYSLTAYHWDNSLVQVTSATKAATGMKIVKKDASNRIVEVFYVVVYGDVTGTGTVLSIGDGTVDATDSMRVLQYAVDKVEFKELAVIAADANHDGAIDANDGLLINQHAVDKFSINQNVTVATVPDECYFLTPVAFN